MKKTIENLADFGLSATTLRNMVIQGGETHDTVEYLGGQACKDKYYETLEVCEIVCEGKKEC